jgi:hypothetical protein
LLAKKHNYEKGQFFCLDEKTERNNFFDQKYEGEEAESPEGMKMIDSQVETQENAYAMIFQNRMESVPI